MSDLMADLHPEQSLAFTHITHHHRLISVSDLETQIEQVTNPYSQEHLAK